MARPKIKWNMGAFKEIRQAPAVKADVLERAGRIARAAGGAESGFDSDSYPSEARARASAFTATDAARAAEANEGTLTRAIDAGRDS